MLDDKIGTLTVVPAKDAGTTLFNLMLSKSKAFACTKGGESHFSPFGNPHREKTAGVAGTLYVVATPIGNLEDITLRALNVLKQVDRIAAEDTRHAAFLLKHFSISKPTFSLHEHNEQERIGQVIQYLHAGESIALVCDSGTPLISDPGFQLVKHAKEAGIPVIPIPGPCAAIAALSAAGLPTDSFIFMGFLPAKSTARDQVLNNIVHEMRTIIFYEAPHRLMETLKALSANFGGERLAVVAREITKLHESIQRKTLDELIQYFESHENEIRGEIVILVAGAKEPQEKTEVLADEILQILLKEMPLKQAVALTSKITKERKNVLYSKALKIQTPQ